nr:cupin domain-containing protein [uncultured Celeribacter sp.]
MTSKKIDIPAITPKIGTLYPPPLHKKTQSRIKRALGDAAGLRQFGVNLTTLPPGTSSALPHWHQKEDEFVYVLSGTPTLILGDHEELLAPGDCAGFKAGDVTAHCLENRSDADVLILEIGSRKTAEQIFYPGLDLMADSGSPYFYHHLDGMPYGNIRRRGPDDD